MNQATGPETITIPTPEISGSLDFYLPVSQARKDLVNKFNEMLGSAVELSGIAVLEDRLLDDTDKRYQTRHIKCGVIGGAITPMLRTAYGNAAEEASIGLQAVGAGDWPSSLITYHLSDIAEENWWGDASVFLRAGIRAPREQLVDTMSRHLVQAVTTPGQFLRNWNDHLTHQTAR